MPRLPRSTPLREKCQICNRRHKTELGEAFCYAYKKFDKEMQPWNPDGSKLEIWPDSKYARRYHANIWPSLAGQVIRRDGFKCQDCGVAMMEGLSHGPIIGKSKWGADLYLAFEVHHILPRGLGGSDHPANLKLVCQDCHKKYNEKFNGQIISKKARERKVEKVKEMMPKSLEEFA